MSGLAWEIINPSDYYTILGDFEAAAVAVLLLGSGAYGMKPVGGHDGPSLPVLLLGGFEEWASEQWGDETLDEVIDRRRVDIGKALGTVLIGNRAEYERSGLGRDEWHDKHRTSMNDIGDKAWKMSEHMLAKAEGDS